MEQILKDALFLANVCDTLQISGYIKQELFDEHAALVENINETIARVFNYAAQQSLHTTPPTEPVNYCNPVNGVHAPFCTGHNTAGV